MRFALLSLLFWACLGAFGCAFGAAPNVVVTIKPLHSIVSSVMQGVASPTLLLPDTASPHTFALKPSTLRALQSADLIVWGGPSLELFMAKSMTQARPNQAVITLSELPGLIHLKTRTGRAWQANDHDHDHDHNHENNNTLDPHLWLSTDNAEKIAQAVQAQLSRLDPDPSHIALYQRNTQDFKEKMHALRATLNAKLANAHTQAYLVYHDGYHYFEEEFKLNAVGTLVLNPHVPLSAQAIQEIGELIKTQHVQCVFRETEFDDTRVRHLLQNFSVKVAELDPLGTHFPAGPDHYEKTLLQIGETLSGCLSTVKK